MEENTMPWELPRFRNWVAVGRVNQLVRKRLADALLEFGLDLPTYDVLSTVYRYAGLTQSELADKLLVGRSNLSMLLPELEKKGLLTRKTDDNDKRIRRVFVTSEGEAMAMTGLKVQLKLIEYMMNSLSDAECDAVGESMHKVIRFLEDQPFKS